jgi:hypothetical protein
MIAAYAAGFGQHDMHVLLPRQLAIVERLEQAAARVAMTPQRFDDRAFARRMVRRLTQRGRRASRERRRDVRRRAAATSPRRSAVPTTPIAPPPPVLGAVTVKLAEAAAALPPAGPVVKRIRRERSRITAGRSRSARSR